MVIMFFALLGSLTHVESELWVPRNRKPRKKLAARGLAAIKSRKGMIMDERYKTWIDNAPEQRDQLAIALDKHGGNDLMVPYAQVALAFPSSNPHEASFDHPMIEDNMLKHWASEHGWRVQLATGNTGEADKYSPPVRFTRT